MSGVETTDEPTHIDAYDPLDDEATLESSRADDDPLAPGRMLGEYRIGSVAGQGGMGIVLSAIHPLIGKRVAIKVLKDDDPAMIARFVSEATVVNQIHHPSIVDIFAFGTTRDGRKYLVMEWLDGESLRHRMDRGRVPLGEALDLLQPLVRALVAAHDKGVIHRDLKPDNIFLTPTGVKLLDFGIAKLVRQDHVSVVQTASGVMVGTPLYAAPEQAAGKPVDHRIDIYTLGAVMFELFAGRPPFMAENAMLVVAKHLLEKPPRMSELAAVPRELDDLVAAMLAKDPDERPTLVHIAAALDRAARGGELVRPGFNAATPTRRLSAPPANNVDLPTAPMMALPEAVEEPAPAPPVVQPRRIPIVVYIVIVLVAIAAGVRLAEWYAARSSPPPPVEQPKPPQPTVTPL